MKRSNGDNDDGLWDELSHQQSREIARHQERNNSGGISSSSTAFQVSSSNNDTTNMNTTGISNGGTSNHQHYHHHPQHHRDSESSLSAKQMASTAVREIGRVAQVVYSAGTAAYQKSSAQQQQQRRMVMMTTRTTDPNHNNPTQYLDDFGIPTEEPLLLNNNNTIHNSEYTSFVEESERHQQQQQHDTPANDFVFLPTFRRRRQQYSQMMMLSHKTMNLDLYFTSLYHYYYHRGLVPIIGKGVVELVTLFGTLILSVFISVYVDWHGLSTCIDESTCHESLNDYVIRHPFRTWSLWNAIVILYILLFLAYGMFAVWSFWHTVQTALESKFVFEDRLGISARKLEGGAIEWETVVAKLLEQQLQSSEQQQQQGHHQTVSSSSGMSYGGQPGQQDLDALVISNRILRKENFMVALVNRGLLDLTVPYLPSFMTSEKNQAFFCSSLEWTIYFCVLNFMFNHKYQIRPAFYLDPSALQRRFMFCGIAHVIFMPFLIFFMTLHFGLQNAYDWKSTKQYLGPRDWSLYAKWTFREFNELPHHFERRLAPSYAATEGYLKLFGQNEIVVALGRILVFFGGGLGTILVAFAAINDAILLHVKISDWNLLWYAGIVGVVFSVGKSMLPTVDAEPKSSRNLFAEIDTALSSVGKYTHHYPDIWKGRGWDQATHKAVSTMFKFKAQLFAMEIASIVLAPYILCVSLAKCAGPICEFVLATKTEIPGAGEVCGYATFDFDSFCDETWEGRTMGGGGDPMVGSLTESVMRIGNVEEARRNFPKPKTRNGKMEKSFFSFKSSHPTWVCPQSGQSLLDRVEKYQREEIVAFGREQQAHIEAAARQLETLAQLEDKRTGGHAQQSNGALGVIHESYLKGNEGAVDDVAGEGNMSKLGPTPPGDSPISDGLPDSETQHTNGLPVAESSNMASRRASSYASLASRGAIPPTGQPNIALSTELRRILNMSTLDADVSIGGSFLAADDLEDNAERRTERQYMWLEKYHNHVASQQQQPQP